MQINNVPNGWSIKRLGDILSITSCKRVHESEWTTSGVPFYRARELVALHDKLPIEPLFISEELYEKNTKLSGCIQAGDLLVTGVGTIGIQYLVKPGDRFYFKDGNIIWLKNEDKINGEFLYYSFDGQFIRKQILNAAGVGTVGTYTIDNAKKTYVMVPPIEEQKKIAEILGTWDRAIEELTGLIAEKKELKRGLMKRLLTGIQRLPGFSASWKQVKLAELFDVKKGAGLSKDVLDKEGKESCILYGELYTTYPEIVRSVISRTDISEGVRSEYGDILIPGSTTTTGIDLANATALLEKGVLLGGDINILRKKQELSSEFFAYLLTHAYRFELAKLAQGITIVHLYGESLKNVDVVVPTDTAEQKAIADVLSKADSEIDLLNQRLDVLKEQKRGLMQKLLTGEIRVKVDME